MLPYFTNFTSHKIRPNFSASRHLRIPSSSSTRFFLLSAIINITSCSAKILSPDRAEYCVSKAAASMATQLLALRLADTKVKVFEIRPGIIKTDMTLSVKDKYDAFIADGLVPEGRWGEPDDVAQVASMLALNPMPYTVGQIFDVDGGLQCHSF